VCPLRVIVRRRFDVRNQRQLRRVTQTLRHKTRYHPKASTGLFLKSARQTWRGSVNMYRACNGVAQV